MKAYLATTAIVFSLIVFAHVLRVFSEGARVLRDPWWIGLTALALILAAWAVSLFVRISRLPHGTAPD